ncbi:MAG: radical SAM family heme chaperone HemW [Phycisphaerales bacterium]
MASVATTPSLVEPRLRAALAARPREDRPRSLYLHIPFCFHKCHYCDFYSIVDRRDRQAAFTDRLVDELSAVGETAGAPLRTIFVGGGTPTLLATDLWRRLLDALNTRFEVDGDTEFTVEANPETVTAELLEILVAGGVNRVSVGAQSFNERHLETLERWHDPASVDRAVALIRAAGVRRLNLDLIFGVPGQTLDEWGDDLERALDLEPEHLSCYSLTYEPNTPMTERLRRGEFEAIDEDLEARLFEWTGARLAAAGFKRYEVSNYARPGEACRHNLAYWRDEEWLALGPSASGHAAGIRWKNAPRLGEYLESGEGWAPVAEIDDAAPATRLAERLMLGLRLSEGLDASSTLRRAAELGVADELSHAINAAATRGHLEATDDRWRLTPAGVLLADRVIAELMAAVDP